MLFFFMGGKKRVDEGQPDARAAFSNPIYAEDGMNKQGSTGASGSGDGDGYLDVNGDDGNHGDLYEGEEGDM